MKHTRCKCRFIAVPVTASNNSQRFLALAWFQPGSSRTPRLKSNERVDSSYLGVFAISWSAFSDYLLRIS